MVEFMEDVRSSSLTTHCVRRRKQASVCFSRRHRPIREESLMSSDTVHLVDSRFETLYQRDYSVREPDMRSLYEKAKRDQWNVSKDIDWSQPVDLDRGLFAD